MKRMSFVRPTDYYDERIYSIDEQLCELLKRRKQISNDNPGFPPMENIAEWAKKYDLYEDLLKSIFGILYNEEHFLPLIEPDKFRKLIPVLKLVEKDNQIFSVPFIRQYNNCSVVNLNIDRDAVDELSGERRQNSFYKIL